jgi:hypothetical protein
LIGDWVARAFPVEGNHLRGSLVVLVNREYSGLVYAVEGVRIPIVPCGVLGDSLCHPLLVREEPLGQLPLDFEGLPSLIEGHHGLSPLGWDATFMENHIDAIFTPLGVVVDHVPLEGLGQEVCSGPVSGMLLLLGGGADVDYLLPRCLDAGFLWGRGSGLGLLGGGSLRHFGGHVLVFSIVVVLACIVVVKVVIVIIVVLSSLAVSLLLVLSEMRR